MKQIITILDGFSKGFRSVFLLSFAMLLHGVSAHAVYANRVISQPAQNNVIGTVYDHNGIPLSGVSVRVKDASQSTVTDVNGQFNITVPDGSSILVIRFIGFKTEEISLTGRSNIEVHLMEDMSKLNEVVVVGYGSQSRETITTSVSKLDEKVLENVPFANAASALQGTLAGVRVQSVTGQPGEAPRVVVRGGTSISNPNGS